MEATDKNTFSRKLFCNHHHSLCLAQVLLHTEKTERMSTSPPDRLPGRAPLSSDDNRWELWQGSSSLFPDNRKLLRPHLHPFKNASAREKLCIISHLQRGKLKHERLYVLFHHYRSPASDLLLQTHLLALKVIELLLD